MTATAAQIAANQANSLKSTGPRTEEGKAASRLNGMKHGLSGEGIVLPQADLGEVDRRTNRLMIEMKPKTERGKVLVRRIAIHSYRMERAFLEETASLTVLIYEAWDEVDAMGITDPDELARARQMAAALASFDYSKEAERARRYEANAERNYHRSMKEFEKVEAEGDDTPLATPAPSPVARELASSCKTPSTPAPKTQPLKPAPATVPLPISTPPPAEPIRMGRPSLLPKLTNDLADVSAIPLGWK